MNAPTATNTLPASEATQAADVMKLGKGVLALMDDLTVVMKEETVILESQKYDGHVELLRRKQRVALDYRTMMKNLATQPEALKQLPERMRHDIRDSTQKLNEATERNARVLRASVVGVQQLLQSVIQIVRSESLTKPGYTDPKALDDKKGTYSPLCDSIAVNRTA